MSRQVLRWQITLVLSLLVLASVGLATSAQSTPPWTWGPILGAVGESTVAVTWETSRSVGFDFSYSLAQIYDSSGQWEEVLTYEGHHGIAEIWLHDLLPGETYRFQLVFYEGDAVYPTEIGTFQTIDPHARSFAFATYGATASHPDQHKLVANTIAAQVSPSVVIHAGGLVEMPTQEHFDNFFWAMSDLGRISPYVTVIGGEDRADGLYFENLALPTGGGLSDEQWWSFDYGSVHFIGLDSTLTSLSEEAAMQEQTAWLKQDLAAAQDKIVIVFSSDPLYSSAYSSGENARLIALWGTLFLEYGVDVVFSSAVHCYEHIYRSGIHHVITGGGGAPLISSPGSSVSGTVFRRYGLLHYMVGTVADDLVQIRAIPVATVQDDILTLSASGRSIDTFVIKREN